MEQKYWHTKQTVIQKLGKEQDSFVVAGDLEVDARLEVGVIKRPGQWYPAQCEPINREIQYGAT